MPVLPFTEEQEHKKQALEEKYRNTPLEVQIDSIDPVGGPITGNTRVTVRGGPFEDMELLYPTPKCKFGSNELITHAQYVRCTEKPLEMEDIEGHHQNRVSFNFLSFFCFYQKEFWGVFRQSNISKEILI